MNTPAPSALRAADVMTTEVATVTPQTPIDAVARLLLDRAISAVPVIDADGEPLGMVSEGDLLGRDPQDRLARRDWWLDLLADRKGRPARLASVSAAHGTAGDVMASPVITVTEDTALPEIALLLGRHRIKRVPVVRDGRLVGIVSRADLLRAFAAAHPAASRPQHQPLTDFVRTVMELFLGSHAGAAPHPVAPAPGAVAEPKFSADTLRGLVEDHQHSVAQQHDAARRARAEERSKLVAEIIDTHVTDAQWQAMLHHARTAAAAGAFECELLRFPATLCRDAGRAINVAEADWPGTLRGEAAELYLRWERELKGRGFHLSARVLDYPDGKPGDIGLFLIWGE